MSTPQLRTRSQLAKPPKLRHVPQKRLKGEHSAHLFSIGTSPKLLRLVSASVKRYAGGSSFQPLHRRDPRQNPYPESKENTDGQGTTLVPRGHRSGYARANWHSFPRHKPPQRAIRLRISSSSKQSSRLWDNHIGICEETSALRRNGSTLSPGSFLHIEPVRT